MVIHSFIPFPSAHVTYLQVKVPVGKHCGFVQFVRKADAERAIEKMQGFPIGGSRIRLSWGRSQCKQIFRMLCCRQSNLIFSDKAAQAAAQAAQAAALQAQFQAQLQAQLASAQASLSPEQALQLLQKIGVNGMNGVGGLDAPMTDFGGSATSDEKCRAFLNQSRNEATNAHMSYDTYASSFSACSPMGLEATEQHYHIRSQLPSAFSPFSPDPNAYLLSDRKRDSVDLATTDPLSQTLNPFPPRFDSGGLDGNTIVDRPNGPLLAFSGSPQYGPYFDTPGRTVEPSRSSSRQEPVSRPTSTQTSSQGRHDRRDNHEEQDPIHDLNGTLASLDLDSRSPWRPTEPNMSC